MTDQHDPDVPVKVEVTEESEQPATTAGEEDHRDPNFYRGEEAEAPADTGKPPQDD
jgi:hypothetical protein